MSRRGKSSGSASRQTHDGSRLKRRTVRSWRCRPPEAVPCRCWKAAATCGTGRHAGSITSTSRARGALGSKRRKSGPGRNCQLSSRVWVAGVSTGTLRDLALAPDGTRLLAAGADESINLTRIRLTPDGGDVAGSEESLSTGHVRDRYPAVSPDGERIVVGTNRIGDNGLWIVAPASGRWTRVEMPQVPEERVVVACWAPNGRESGRKAVPPKWNGDVLARRCGWQRSGTIGPASADSSAPLRCAFSPDGQQLLYTRIVEGFSQLFVLDLTTRRDRALTHSDSHKYEGTWSPDGRWIAFSANTGGTLHVWRIPAAGGWRSS